MTGIDPRIVARCIKDIEAELNAAHPTRQHTIHGKKIDMENGRNWVAQTAYAHDTTDTSPSTRLTLDNEAEKLNRKYPVLDFSNWAGELVRAGDA